MTTWRKARLAAMLWIVLAVVVWNVVFDRVIVLAGRRYVYDASLAARAGWRLPIDASMRPAVARGVRLASGVSIAIAVFGMAAVVLAVRGDRRDGRFK
jgi:hypothetical protein